MEHPGSILRTSFKVPINYCNPDIAKGNFYWRNYVPDNLPEDALNIADGEYIGQVSYYENLLPVAIFPEENIAIGERAGKRVFDENIKILCTPDPTKFYWQSVDFDVIRENSMKNVVKGGYQDGHDLYIGRGSCPYQSIQVKIGKVVPIMSVSWKGLQVWGDYEQCVIIKQFEILKYGSSTIAYEDPVLTGFYWRDYVADNLPSDAFEACDGKYIGQINRYGDIPVTVCPVENIAVLERRGKKTIVDENIKILCSPNCNKFYWEHVDLRESLGRGPIKNAVMGGHKDYFYLFIGRIHDEGEWKIGKVFLTENLGPLGLNVWDKDEKSMAFEKFEILKYNVDKV